MGLDLKRYFDHGVSGEGAVKIVQLLSTCGPDREGDTQVVARFAGPHFKRGRIEAGVELLGNLAHGFCKTIDPCTHDFDGKVTGVLNQRFFVGGVGKRGLCRSAHKKWVVEMPREEVFG